MTRKQQDTADRPLCARCGKRPRRQGGHRVCSPCHRAVHDPPIGNPHGRGISRKPSEVQARVEEYRFLLDMGMSLREIATTLGVCVRTLKRYQQRMDAEQENGAP